MTTTEPTDPFAKLREAATALAAHRLPVAMEELPHDKLDEFFAVRVPLHTNFQHFAQPSAILALIAAMDRWHDLLILARNKMLGSEESRKEAFHLIDNALHGEPNPVGEIIAERDQLAAENARLREALDQLLDDMGETGLCVCQAAKEQARAALEGK